jgi:50S ribosomal subunit-associated GTPase HflX
MNLIKKIKFLSYFALKNPTQIHFSKRFLTINSFNLSNRQSSIHYLDNDNESHDKLHEDLFWDRVRSTLDYSNEHEETKFKQHKSNVEKNVFVLQLKMQFKSKSRQSTSADLQLAESISLVQTLSNWRVIESHIVGAKRSFTREIFGSGNQEILSKKIASSGANCLFIVIDRLTNAQVKSLRETLLGNNPDIHIYDRYKIVLEIFKRNARSDIAKLQIALAEIPYIRHRYENNELYKNVEKKIKKELEAKIKTRNLLNAQRREKKLPLVSVFGYTNVGKTSFIKALTNDSKMKPENKLFATLDVTYHGASLSNSNQHIIFADTIGFISDIPTNLIEAFKTSLNDTLNADLYVHLIDISHPDRHAQQESVLKILSEMAPENNLENMLTVYNKCDKLSQFDFKKIKNETASINQFFISCKTAVGLEELRERIEKLIYKQLDYIRLSLKIEQGSQEWSFLNKYTIVQEAKENESDGQFLTVKVLINKVNALNFVKLFPLVEISKE